MATATIDVNRQAKTATLRIYDAYTIEDALGQRDYQFVAGDRDEAFEARFGTRGGGDDAHWQKSDLDNMGVMQEWAALRQLGVAPRGSDMLVDLEANWERLASAAGIE